MSTVSNEALDEIARSLTRLDLDSLIVVCVNSLAQLGEPTPQILMSRIATVIVTASALLDEGTKIDCIDMLRDAADVFEHSLAVMKRLN